MECLVTGHFCSVANSYSISEKSGSRNPAVFGKLRKATAADSGFGFCILRDVFLFPEDEKNGHEWLGG